MVMQFMPLKQSCVKSLTGRNLSIVLWPTGNKLTVPVVRDSFVTFSMPFGSQFTVKSSDEPRSFLSHWYAQCSSPDVSFEPPAATANLISHIEEREPHVDQTRDSKVLNTGTSTNRSVSQSDGFRTALFESTPPGIRSVMEQLLRTRTRTLERRKD